MNDPGPERFKWAMLHVAVGDPPWNTGMAWVDAVDAFQDREPAEVDAIVRDALLDLLDKGYVFFYRFTDWEDEFRPRTPDEGLPREEVAAVLASGRLPSESAEGASITAAASLGSGAKSSGEGRKVALGELLAFRATEAGIQRHSELSEADYTIFGRG